MSSKNIFAQLGVKGDKEFKQKMQGVEKQLDNMGRGGAGLDKALRSIGPGAAVAVAGAVAIGAALRGAAQMAQRAAEQFRALGNAGAQMSASFHAFQRAGGSLQMMQQMDQAVGGLVERIHLVPRATQVLRTGIVNFDQFNRVLAATVRAAQDHGKDINSALTGMTAALSGGGLEEYAQTLGVALGDVREELRRYGETLETTEGRQRGIEIILREMGQTLGEVDNSANNAGDAFRRLEVATKNYYTEVGQAVAEDARLVQLFTDLERIMTAAVPASDNLADALVRMFLSGVESARAFAEVLARVVGVMAEVYSFMERWERITNPMAWIDHVDSQLTGGTSGTEGRVAAAEGLVGSMTSLVDILGDVGGALDGVAGAAGRLGSSIDGVNSGTSTMRDELDDILDMIDERGAYGRTINVPPPRGRGRGGGRRQFSPTALQTGVMAGATMGDTRRDADVAGMDEATAVLGVIMEQVRVEEDAASAEMAAQEELARLSLQQKEFEDQRHQERLQQIEEREEREAAAAADAKQRALDIAAAASGAIGTMGNLFGQIADLMEAQGKSAKTLRKIQGGFLVAYNVALAATEVARAIGSYPDVAGIIAHSASAAAHVVAAGVAAARLGGGNASGANASAGAAASARFQPTEPERMSSPSEGSGGINITKKYYLSENMAQLGAVVEQGRYEMRRHSMTDPVPANIEWD